MYRKPNFFIIGAPKCGTTSLASWLAEHPRVFMSMPKELHYFDFDRKKGFLDDLSQYEKFFKGASAQHIAIGEASPSYLRSNVAITEILQYSPDAKFVVGLRNPIDMVASWHSEMLVAARENEQDVVRAWLLQDKRRLGLCVPSLCSDKNDLLYGDVCSLGSQLERLYSVVSRERVFIFTLDEMQEDARSLWQSLQDFLGVPDDNRQMFPAMNTAKSMPRTLSVIANIVTRNKRRFGIEYRTGILNVLSKVMVKKRNINISDDFRKELRGYFYKEINLLSEVVGRDFSSWL